MPDTETHFSARIAFEGEPTATTSQRLEELRTKLGANDLVGVPKKVSAPGKKGDWTVAIDLAALGLSAISTFIAVLSYWRSQPETPPSITIIHVDHQVTLRADHDAQQVQRELRLDQARPGAELKVVVKEQ